MDFDEYTRKHDRDYEPGSQEYHHRRELFEQRAAEVAKHNSQPDRTWTAAINHLTDRTEDELKNIRGYRRTDTSDEAPTRASLLGTSSRAVHFKDLPIGFSWSNLRAAKVITDQKDCGSCWAVSASEAIAAHTEIHNGTSHRCSVGQLVACTPNPKHCGGDGGCSGSTGLLAMEYILENGCLADSDWSYSGQTEACPNQLEATDKEIWKDLDDGSPVALHRDLEGGLGSHLGMVGYQKIPENTLEPLLIALYERGPVVTSVFADSRWNGYSKGILNACDKAATINHAVLLTGWGEANMFARKMGYWVIQNSWGPEWGEGGTVRLQRHSHAEEGLYCGWDDKPHDGSGCLGGPEKVWVCGSCGLLYDNVVPVFRTQDVTKFERTRQMQRTTQMGKTQKTRAWR